MADRQGHLRCRRGDEAGMKTDTKFLTVSQQIGWNTFLDERALAQGREARFIGACLKELGGKPQENWRFDYESKCFFREVEEDGSTD